MPHARPLQIIGPRCHELRVTDAGVTWRLIYRVDDDAIIVLDVFAKKTPTTPKGVVDRCRRRLLEYDHA